MADPSPDPSADPTRDPIYRTIRRLMLIDILLGLFLLLFGGPVFGIQAFTIIGAGMAVIGVALYVFFGRLAESARSRAGGATAGKAKGRRLIVPKMPSRPAVLLSVQRALIGTSRPACGPSPAAGPSGPSPCGPFSTAG